MAMNLQLLGAGLGLGLPADLDAAITEFLLRSPSPDSTAIVEFLQVYPEGSDRSVAAQALLAKGVPAQRVSAALNWLDARSGWAGHKSTIYGVLTLASSAASAFHGYRRNNSIGWGLLWGVAGMIFPVTAPAIALAQGFGKRKAA